MDIITRYATEAQLHAAFLRRARAVVRAQAAVDAATRELADATEDLGLAKVAINALDSGTLSDADLTRWIARLTGEAPAIA